MRQLLLTIGDAAMMFGIMLLGGTFMFPALCAYYVGALGVVVWKRRFN